MSKFESINYSRVICKECREVTIIEPGREFKKLNCNCVNELSTPFQEIHEYVKEDGTTVELVGEFKNGDYEIKYPNGNLEYRISKIAFDKEFKKNIKVDDNVYLTLDDLREKSIDEIKEEFLLDELRILARNLKIRGASQMNEIKLVERLLEKVE